MASPQQRQSLEGQDEDRDHGEDQVHDEGPMLEGVIFSRGFLHCIR